MATAISLASRLAALDKAERDAYLGSLTRRELLALSYDWRVWARDSQLAPDGGWRTWVYRAGRGAGKTRAGAEYVRERVNAGAKRLVLIAPTADAMRDVMIEGESGLMSVFPPDKEPLYEPSKRRVTFDTGARAGLYSADEPERLRGPQADTLWVDELSAMRRPRYTYDMAMFGLRLGSDPRCVITATPKPLELLRQIEADPATALTRSSTYDNRANLAGAFFEQIVSRYEGSTLAEQEIHGEILDSYAGALFSRELIVSRRAATHPPLQRVVVALDPAISADLDSDFTGLCVAGIAEDGRAYVLESHSLKTTPDAWARRAVALYHHYEAAQIIGERNQGGDMITATLRAADRSVPVKLVNATKAKRLRAEPVATLFEQDKARLYSPGTATHETLENQMLTHTGEPGETSPDELDSCVYAISELMLEPSKPRRSVRVVQ